nr:MAG TPA: tail protein [Caudoviricetes sp.]
MITFYDEKGNGYGAQVELKTKNAVNGERSISGTIVSNKQVLSKLDRGWSFTFDGELYKIIYAKPKDEGKNISLSFDAVHQFFYDFEHSNCYKEFNGSNRFEVYIEAIFKDSGYRYVIEAQAGSIRKENFGNASRLKMFKEIIKAAGLEFSVTGKVVRILKKVGTDLSTVVRKNFNMNELTIEKNIGNFITYKKGLGAWKDENNHDAGRYTSEYESPLARIYGRIEGEPVTDERYKETGKLLERLKKEVDESYSISVQLDMEDLTQAGYKYTRPRAGDYIMAINETIGFREKIRIVSYESSYDVTGRLLSHKVTCNDIGTVQKAITSEGSIMRSVSESKEYAEGALEVATRALVSANGKNTNYYGTTKPKDEPRGTLHEGDLLYLTVGEETELCYWSGTEWLPKILKVDTSKIEKIVNDAQASTNQAIAQANAKAEEALKKAGTLPDTSKLSDQIKQQILSSPDLQNKVTEGVNSVDGDTIYSKIVSKVSRNFTTKGEFDLLDRVQNDMGRDLIGLSRKVTAQTLEFNKLTESNKLYERIIGTSETDAPDKLSRLVMSSQIFQTEVGKYAKDDFNLVYDPTNFSKWGKKGSDANIVEVGADTKLLRITTVNKQSSVYQGFSLPLMTSTFTEGEKLSYRMELWVDVLPDGPMGLELWGADGGITSDRIYLNKTGWQVVTGTMTVKRSSNKAKEFPFEIWLMRNGTVAVGKVSLIRGDTPPKSFRDDTSPQEITTRTQVSQLNDSYAIRALNSAGDILGQLNLNKDGSIKLNDALIAIGDKTYVKDGVIKKAMIGNGQIGTAHIGEIDANIARLINVSAKNIVADGLTANIIKGGKLSSLNGVTNFDLQTGWIDMNKEGVGIRNQFANRPLQYLVFGSGAIGKKSGTYTAIMSNSHNRVAMDDGSAGIQIWNTNDNTTAVNIYGDLVEFMYNANDKKSILFDTQTNIIYNIEDIALKNNLSLIKILDKIFDNFRNLDHDGNYQRNYYPKWT